MDTTRSNSIAAVKLAKGDQRAKERGREKEGFREKRKKKIQVKTHTVALVGVLDGDDTASGGLGDLHGDVLVGNGDASVLEGSGLW